MFVEVVHHLEVLQRVCKVIPLHILDGSLLHFEHVFGFHSELQVENRAVKVRIFMPPPFCQSSLESVVASANEDFVVFLKPVSFAVQVPVSDGCCRLQCLGLPLHKLVGRSFDFRDDLVRDGDLVFDFLDWVQCWLKLDYFDI